MLNDHFDCPIVPSGVYSRVPSRAGYSLLEIGYSIDSSMITSIETNVWAEFGQSKLGAILLAKLSGDLCQEELF